MSPAAVLCLALACIAVWTPKPVRADALQSFLANPLGPIQNELKAFGQFLSGGPKQWTAAVKPQATALMNLDGTLKENARTQYLSVKRALSPQQFDLRHPRLAAAFQKSAPPASGSAWQTFTAPVAAKVDAQALQVLLSPPAAPPAVVVGPATEPRPATALEVLAPMAVPEPSGLVTAAAILGLAGGWRRLRRARTIPPE
jgi:hypothetical protein